MLCEALEQRLLLSADWLPTLAPVQQDLGTVPGEEQAGVFEDLPYGPGTQPSVAIVRPTPLPAAPPARELVFVDADIVNRAALLAAVGLDGADQSGLIILDAGRDGIAQIGDALRGAGRVSAVHILSHGSAGGLQIGGTWLDASGLDAHANAFADWRAQLTDEADILLYACNVAASPAGVELVDQLAHLTGADVAASTDPTGAEVLGGDWDLEFVRGAIEARLLTQQADAPVFGHLLETIDIPSDEASVTLTAATLEYRGPGGEVDNAAYSFRDNKEEAVAIVGSANRGQTFYFEARPDLSADALLGSSLDGGSAAANALDFTSYGGANTKLGFIIDATSQAGGAGIAVVDDNASILPKAVRIQSIQGGPGTATDVHTGFNRFSFVAGWDANLTVLGSTQASNVNNGMLDFSGFNADLTATLDASGAQKHGSVKVSDGNHTVTGVNINAVSVADGRTLDLDLSALDEDVTIRVIGSNAGPTKVEISSATTAVMTFARVGKLTLGQQKNTLKFESGGSVGNIYGPWGEGNQQNAGYADFELVLDYGGFGRAATVNLGAKPDLAAQSNLNGPVDAGTAGVAAEWKIWSPAALPAVAQMHLSYGGYAAPAVNVVNLTGSAAGVQAAIGQAVDAIAALKNGAAGIQRIGDVTGSGTTNDPWIVRLNRTAATPQQLGAAEASTMLARVGPSTWRVAVGADSGTFTLTGLQNGGDAVTTMPIDLRAARADSAQVKNAVQGAILGSAVTVTGSGTTASPWEISLGAAIPNATLDAVTNTAGLVGTQFLVFSSTVVGAAPRLKEWTLSNTATAGAFKLQVTTANGVGTTGALRFDADATEIEAALKALTEIGTASVTGNGDGSWSIGLVDDGFGVDQLALAVLDASPNITAYATSGVGGLDVGTANGIAGLTVTGIVGSVNSNDRLYYGANTAIVISAPSGANLVAGGSANDRLTSGNGSTVSGGGGDDTITGGDGATNTLSGGAGADLLTAGGSGDILYGGAGNDFDDDVTHTQAAQQLKGLIGGDGADMLYGGPGDDGLFGEGGVDHLYGGGGADRLHGGAANDILHGGADGDFLYGDADKDELYGEDGADRLEGGAGDDELTGGAGADSMMGGLGEDTFSFSDGWDMDAVVDGGADADTADFSKVTRNLTFTFPAALPAADGELAPAVNVRSENNEDSAPLTNIEKIKGGAGWDHYKVEAGWVGTIEILDAGSLDTLDLSAETADLRIEVKQTQVVVNRDPVAGAGIKVSKITVANLSQLIVGQGTNTIQVTDANPPALTISAPRDANGNIYPDHQVVIDTTGLGAQQALSFTAAVNLAEGPAGLSTLVRTAGADATESVWQMVVTDELTPFTLTFGDREGGQQTTGLITLYTENAIGKRTAKADAVQRAAIQSALSALTNVAEDTNNVLNQVQTIKNGMPVALPWVLVQGSGTQNDPFTIRIKGKIGVNPILSSAKYAVGSIATLEPVESETMPGVFNPRQAVSLFVDGSLQPFTLNVLPNAPAAAFKGFIGSASDLRTEVAAGANTAIDNIEVSGEGTHDDPWIVTYRRDLDANLAAGRIVGFDSLGKNKSRGALMLQNVADPALTNANAYAANASPHMGTAGSAAEFRLHNTANAGRFTLTFGGQTTSELSWDATAAQLRDELASLANAGTKVLDSVEVTGSGRPNDDWIIELIGADNTAPGLNGLTIADAWPAQTRVFPFSISTGVNLELRLGGAAPDFIGPTTRPLVGEGSLLLFAGDDGSEITGSNTGDTIFGGAGDDTLRGSGGNDVIADPLGTNMLAGGSGNDIITGGSGADTISGGDGNDVLRGGDGQDELSGDAGNDLLNGGRLGDTYSFQDGWGHDTIVEAPAKANKGDVLDFSQVTQSLTHVLSGGELVSGVKSSTFSLEQSEAGDALTEIAGRVTVHDELGFVVGQRAAKKSGNVSLEADYAFNFGADPAANPVQTLRLAVDYGDGNGEQVVEVVVTGAGSAADAAAAVQIISNALAAAKLDNVLSAAASGNKVELTLAGAADGRTRSIRILPSAASFTNSVSLGKVPQSTIAGYDPSLSRLHDLGAIKAASADNTFLFGSDWRLANDSKFFWDYATASASFSIPELEIDTSMVSEGGFRLVLDFRHVDQELSFTFDDEGDGKTSLTVGRFESFSLPTGISIDLPVPGLLFNTVKFTNVDANTVIFTGRNANYITLDKGANFAGTLIASTGLVGKEAMLNPNNWVPYVLAGEFPNWFVVNEISYSGNVLPRQDQQASLGGISNIF
ncbi:MAG: DUF4347 domain-containing protein, partial [Candidatus Accumulibacter sp.]|nr:DUF4347 domain-containing protein [Accumulibacter sp.]